jgi:hypothetical protein
MISSRNIVKLLLHLFGWGVLLLLVLLQNDLSDWNDEDYFLFAIILVCIGIVAYINLYFLIPRYLFAKKYAHYTGFLFVLVFLTASLITWVISDLDLDSIDWSSRFVVTLIALAALALLTSAGKFLIEYLRKMMKLKEIENKQLKAELNLLKDQVNPHFLFNTLNNLYGLITQDQNKRAAEVTLKLADLMRYLLESSKADKVSLKKEIQFLGDYLSLEKIRLTNNTAIRFEVSGIDSDVFVAPLLFIPLVENVFKHGLQTISKDSFHCLCREKICFLKRKIHQEKALKIHQKAEEASQISGNDCNLFIPIIIYLIFKNRTMNIKSFYTFNYEV